MRNPYNQLMAVSGLPPDLAARRCLNLKQLSEYTGLSVDRLRRLIAEGKGPRVSRPGGRLMFCRVSDADEWLATCAEPEAA
jgi:predicted DNA-binding transcriptional regulator AlpA